MTSITFEPVLTCAGSALAVDGIFPIRVPPTLAMSGLEHHPAKAGSGIEMRWLAIGNSHFNYNWYTNELDPPYVILLIFARHRVHNKWRSCGWAIVWVAYTNIVQISAIHRDILRCRHHYLIVYCCLHAAVDRMYSSICLKVAIRLNTCLINWLALVYSVS